MSTHEDRRSLTIVRLDAAKRAMLARRNHNAYRDQLCGAYEPDLADPWVQARIAREIAAVPGIDQL
jgi:hypothetical protein